MTSSGDDEAIGFATAGGKTEKFTSIVVVANVAGDEAAGGQVGVDNANKVIGGGATNEVDLADAVRSDGDVALGEGGGGEGEGLTLEGEVARVGYYRGVLFT